MSGQNTFASDSIEKHLLHPSVECAAPALLDNPTSEVTGITIFSILDIPHILVAVRNFLSKTSIRRCCLVSHAFHELFIPGLWQRLELGFMTAEKALEYGGYPIMSFREAIALYGHHVRHLSFIASSGRTGFFFKGKVVEQVRGVTPDTPLEAPLPSDDPTSPRINWKDSAKMKVSSVLRSRPWKRKAPKDENPDTSFSTAPVTTMAKSPVPIALLGQKDSRRYGGTAELCPNMTSLHIEISSRLSLGWSIQEAELVLLYVARNQGLRSLTLENFPIRSQTMAALLFRVLSEQVGLQELRLKRGPEVSGGLMQALLLNLPRTGQSQNGRPQGSSSLRLLEVGWSIDEEKYTEGYWSHGEWHAHDPNHPDKIRMLTLEEGPDGSGSVLWPMYSSLHTLRFLGKLQGCEESLVIPFLKHSCLNLMELHCHNVEVEKREAIQQATRAVVCCFEDEMNCITNEISV